MRNLIVFLWKYNFFIFFLLLETLSAYLIFENSNFQRSSMINSSNAFAGNIVKTVLGMREYIHLKETNEHLADENASLKANLNSSLYADTTEKKAVNDSIFKQKYVFIAAKAINNSTNKRNNYLTLDRGSLSGIKPQMGVVSASGVVGIVKDVSPNFSTVISLLHKESKISVRLKKNNVFGSLVWDGEAPDVGSLLFIPKHVQLNKGDTLVTSSYSKIFPEGIVTGIITEFNLETGDNFYTVKVHLTTDFYSLTHVFVVSNLMKDEQEKIESKLENAN